jgi:adenylate cyclase
MKRWGSPSLWHATLRSRAALDWILSKLALNDHGMKDDLTIEGGVAHVSLKPPATWQAYDHYLRAATAWALFQSSWKLENLVETRQHLAESLKDDPKYARAHSLLASTHRVAWLNALNDEYLNPSTLDRAITSAYTAIELDPNLPDAYAELGYTIIRKGDFAAAAAAAKKAIALNPNFADYRIAQVLFSVGEPAKAIDVAKAQMQRDPSHPHFAPLIAGEAYYLMKQYRDARRCLREATRRAPDHQYSHAFLAAACAQLGQLEEARAEAAKVLELNPNYTIRKQKEVSILKHQKDIDHIVDGLRKAGLPE